MNDRPCNCPPNETDTLDGVTIPRHTYSCPNHNSDGPRWYVWQGFDEPACLEAGTLVDFARGWGLYRDTKQVPGAAVEPVEVRTWDRTYRAVIAEERVDVSEAFGTFLVRVEDESVVERVALAERARVS